MVQSYVEVSEQHYYSESEKAPNDTLLAPLGCGTGLLVTGLSAAMAGWQGAKKTAYLITGVKVFYLQ